jgi:hypothetical protein
VVTTFTAVALFIIGTGIGVGALALILIAIDDARDAIVDAIKRGPDPVAFTVKTDPNVVWAVPDSANVAAAYESRRKYDGRL